MEEVYVVRQRHLVEGVPIRRLAREMSMSKNTIKRYLRGAAPGVGKPWGVRGAPVRDAVESRTLELLEDSKRWTAGKQRLTAARLHTMLRSEGRHVGYTVVKDIVREWKRQRKEVFVPLVYKPAPSVRWRRQNSAERFWATLMATRTHTSPESFKQALEQKLNIHNAKETAQFASERSACHCPAGDGGPG